MKKVFIFSLLAIVLIACDKDKFQTKPQVEIKSLSPDVVTNKGFFSLDAVVRDKEGDLQDTMYLVQKLFAITTGTLLWTDTSTISLTDFGFPDKNEIEVEAVFSYGEIRQGTIYKSLEPVDRNFSVGLIVKDRAGNKSDYVESNTILLKKL